MSDSRRQGYGKLLDAWVAPESAGDPIGCLATSFTFDAAFFEEECLARFLGLQSDPEEDGPIYLIEREEKLAGATCAALVDARHCRGPRSLRWDLLPARVPGGAMHAKVSLLCWQHRVRVIVASANLTEDGYRRNQEVFGVLDFHEDGQAPVACLEEIAEFLEEAAGFAAEAGSESPVLERWRGVLEHARAIGQVADDGASPVGVRPVLVGPGRDSALDQIRASWPARLPPRVAHVVSPFFDPPEAENRPARQVWEILRRRGEAEVTYHVTVEQAPGEETVVAHAPESLMKATPGGRQGVATRFARLREQDLPDETPMGFRPLHAKTLWLDNGNWAYALIGSSNFTSAGLGLSRSPNVEANLAYWVSRRREPKAYRALRTAQLRGEAMDPEQVRLWEARPDETDPDEVEWPALPAAFDSAVLEGDEKGVARLVLTLAGTPPADWAVFDEDREEALYDEARWKGEGQPRQVRLAWTDAQPPTGLEVAWRGANARAWWPVNVADATTLPPPAELAGLSLDALIHILTSARPLKEAMRAWLRRKRTAEKGAGDQPDEIDPHKRVDTSRFLLQRTRRVSWALAGLRERLERPVPTRQVLHWRLHGPVGVRRVAEALEAEKRSDEEYAFLMAELLLELSRVAPREADRCLAPDQVRGELREFIREAIPELREGLTDAAPATRAYIEQVIEELLGARWSA